MIKGLSKFLLYSIILLIILIFYLSFFGIKTKVFNDKIRDEVLKINKSIKLELKDIEFLLQPTNFSVNIKTVAPEIFLNNNQLKLAQVKTNISLKSFINKKFSIDNVNISTKLIKLKDVISLLRSFKNSPQLMIFDTFVKDGLLSADIILNFNGDGKIKSDYQINGYIKNTNLGLSSKHNIENLNLFFKINEQKYLLESLEAKFNKVKFYSESIQLKKNKDLFLISGDLKNKKNDSNSKLFKELLKKTIKNVEIKNIDLSSKNNFSFTVNKKFKFDNLKVQSIIELNEIIINKKDLDIKSYLPSFNEEIKIQNHKININYKKNKFDIKGNGNILLEDKIDNISYLISKNKNTVSFDSKINIKNNSLIIDFLDYEKKEGLNSLILIKGNYKKNKQLRFDLISLKEKNNKILIKGLDLNKNFKIISVKKANINYTNNHKVLNNFKLKKDKSIFIIEGESFDASRIINNIMDSDEESSLFFDNLNSKINIKIKKTYIDEINYINNLNGHIDYVNNKVSNLKLDSEFPNKKRISLSIKTKNNSETLTRLFSGYPKPLVKRYDFINGFEDGYMDFYSSKKEGVSNSVLVIDNFKVKEVPAFAKILSLASLQGIADLLTGEGIRFTDFEMNFSNQKGLITIDELYAIGPAVSILMDGYIENKKLVSLRGTLVPATTINRSIASIPLLGKILIGDKTGEGVFGVSFKIKGPPNNLKTSVNPIKTLTPRFITRTIEKIKKN